MRHCYISDFLEDSKFLKYLSSFSPANKSDIHKEVLESWRAQLLLDNNNLFLEMLNAYEIDEHEFNGVLDYYFTASNQKQGTGETLIFRNDKNRLFSSFYDAAPLFLNVFSKILIETDSQIKAFLKGSTLLCIDKATTDLIIKCLYDSLFSRIADMSGEMLSIERKVLEEKALLETKVDNDLQKYEKEFLSDVDFCEYLLDEYPVLFRIVKEEADKFVGNTAQFISRLDKDFPLILGLTGEPDNKIVGLDGNIGYYRANGKSAYIIKFEKGKSIVYKPWNLKMQAVFGNFIERISSSFQNPLFAPSVIQKEHYGWMEYVEESHNVNQHQILRNGKQIGAMLAIGYILDATDFHIDNFIFTEKGPMLIDCETLFHPEEYVVSNKTKTTLTNNDVLKTGFFARMDTPHYFYKSLLKSTRARESLLNGFTQCYNHFLNHKKLLFEKLSGKFKDCKIRVVMRDNQIYDHLLKERLKPETLTDGYKSDMLFDWLWGLVNEFPYLKKVIRYEKRSLLKNELPIFTTKFDSKHIYYNEEVLIQNVVSYSAKEMLEDKLSRLNMNDQNQQLLLIKNILDQTKSNLQSVE